MTKDITKIPRCNSCYYWDKEHSEIWGGPKDEKPEDQPARFAPCKYFSNKEATHMMRYDDYCSRCFETKENADGSD